jgi:hypothetical protein
MRTMLFGCFGLGGGEAAEAGSGSKSSVENKNGKAAKAVRHMRDSAAAVADAGRPVADAGLVGAACLHAARELHGGEGGRED